MLSPEDHALVSRDPRLPGLRLLLDPEALRPHLDPWLAPGESLTPIYLRYSIGDVCIAGYTVDRPAARGGPLDLHLVAYPGRPRYARRHRTKRTTPQPLRHESIAVYVFPEDAELAGLNALARPEKRTHLFSTLVPDHPELWPLSPVRLRYKPRRRFVGRLGAPEGPAALLKFYTPADYDRAKQNARQLKPITDFLRPGVLTYRNHYCAVARDWIAGIPLTSASPEAHWRSAGIALARLHAVKLGDMSPRSAHHRSAHVAGVGQWLAALHPELAALAAELAARLSAAPRARSHRMSHGDFYAEQVLISSGGAVLLDFDRAAVDAPESDLGNMLAHVEAEALVSTDARPPWASFLDAYESSAPPPDVALLRHFTALSLFALAPRPFRSRQRDWLAGTLRVLQRCREILDGRGSLPAPGVSAPVDPLSPLRTDPAFTFLAPLLAAPMELLRDYLPPAQARRITGLRLLRHKPGRRALLAIDQSGGPALLAKVRARGADADNFQLLRALWDAGFNDRSPVAIPQPLAMVESLHLWLQPQVPGQAFVDSLSAPGTPHRAAEALARLHAAPVTSTKTHTRADELRMLNDRLARAAALCPPLAERIEAIGRHCHELLSTLPPGPEGLLHRDFYHDQLLLTEDRVYLLDLDLAARGERALDAGNFLAHLHELSLRRPQEAPRLQAAAAEFSEAYASANAAITPAALHAFTFVSLARHLYLTTQFPDRTAFTEPLLGRLERLAGQS
jgi:aminoglycoside phosphotransferase (APT) family kinase protein